MHARFNLDPDGEGWGKYFPDGKAIFDDTEKVVKNKLKSYENAKGVIKAEDIIDSWFPEVKADIFISHSHKDENIAIGFAGWLKRKFGITAFIDSLVWQHSRDLLRILDEEYNKTGEGIYCYEGSNRAAGHVHAMVLTALFNMIDQSECLMFINTDKSFKPSDFITGSGSTTSPWIYSEISMASIARQKSVWEHRATPSMEELAKSMVLKESKEPPIEYKLDTLHLTPLSIDDLNNWEEEFGSSDPHRLVSWFSDDGKVRSRQDAYRALDILYKMKRTSS